MKYKVFNRQGHVIRRMLGGYVKDLARLHKFAPCTIEQEADIPDDENNRTTIIRLDPPATNRKRPRKFRLRVLFCLLVALLATSCTESPANGNLPIADLETGQYCEPSHTPDYRAIVFAQNELIIAYEEKTEELASVIMTAFPAYRSDYHDIDSLSNILDSLYIN